MELFDERDLVDRIEAGDPTAEAAFHDHFRGRIHTFAARRGVPREDCQDIAQEVIVGALVQLRAGKFDRRSSLGTWMHRIMARRVADFFRARGRARLVPLAELTEDHDALVRIRDDEQVVEVREALGRLSTEDQLLLVLHEQQRYTLKELAKAWGLSTAAVGARLTKARQRFRQTIGTSRKSTGVGRLKD